MLRNQGKIKVAIGISSKHVRPKAGRRAGEAEYARRADMKWYT